MVKKTSRTKVERNLFGNFFAVSENFYEGANLAYEFEYFNASGVLFVHAAIALADAVTIKLSGVKCAGGNHYEIAELLREVTPESKGKKSAINQFKKIIDHKNLVSYSGDIYLRKDIVTLKKNFERFSAWAKDILE